MTHGRTLLGRFFREHCQGCTVPWRSASEGVSPCAQFNKHCHLRYGQAVRKMPLEMAATAPAATVDPSVYLPPALRSRLCCAAPCVMTPDPREASMCCDAQSSFACGMPSVRLMPMLSRAGPKPADRPQDAS